MNGFLVQTHCRLNAKKMHEEIFTNKIVLQHSIYGPIHERKVKVKENGDGNIGICPNHWKLRVEH
jgi:hypothetical protein